MLNASSLAMPKILLLFIFVLNLRFSSPVILRLHSSALRDLGQMTRNWMRESVKRHFPLRSHSKHLAHRFGQGRLQLHNLSIVDFSPPDVHFQASKNSLLYMSMDGGNSQLDAQWSLQSDFLLSLIRSPAFAGIVRARIVGFSADISIKVIKNSHLVIHQCISRFDEFQLHLGGSLAADLIHWFHRPLAQALQSHVEETYCQLIGEKLLPWLHEQLAKLALKLRIDFGGELQLNQWLHSVKIGDGYLDLGMAQRLIQRGGEKGGRDRVLAESLPSEMPAAKFKSKENIGEHSLDLFLHESTLQQVFSGAHHSHKLRVNFSSPFLRTNCPLLCLGKFVPQMRAKLGPTELLAVLRTNNPPDVRLLQQKIRLNLNISFELFENRKIKREVEEGIELMANYDGIEEEENGEFDQELEEKEEEDDEEELAEIEEVEREKSIEVLNKGNALVEVEEEVDGTLIRPKFIGVNGGGPRIIDFGQNGKTSTTMLSTIVFTQSTQKGEQIVESTTTQVVKIGPINKNRKFPSKMHHEPILRILLNSEMEILLELEKKRRRMKTELKFTKVRAILAQSDVRNLSQETIDLLVEASIPFLENSIKILYRDGIELDGLMTLPTGNESINIEDGFIRYSADVHLAQILQ